MEYKLTRRQDDMSEVRIQNFKKLAVFSLQAAKRE